MSLYLHDSCLILCAVRGGGGGNGVPQWQTVFHLIMHWSPWFPPSAWRPWWYMAWLTNSETLWPASSSLSTTTLMQWLSASPRLVSQSKNGSIVCLPPAPLHLLIVEKRLTAMHTMAYLLFSLHTVVCVLTAGYLPMLQLLVPLCIPYVFKRNSHILCTFI